MSIFITLCLVSAWLYVILILFIIRNWIKQEDFQIKNHQASNFHRDVTVLIPARNEEQNIGACLSSLLNCKDFEHISPRILVVNDYSEDQTVAVAKSYPYNRLEVLDMRDSAIPRNNSSKKKALEYALGHINTEYIIQLDADVKVHGDYLRTVMHFIDETDADFIAAPVKLSSRGTGFQDFQQLDYIGMMALTQAGIWSRRWYLANGANMIYKKESIDFDTDGFASGDDVSAVRSVAQSGGEILFLKSRGAVVDTCSISSFAEFIQQRLRWAGKNSSSQNPQMLAVMLISLLSSVLLFLIIPLFFAVDSVLASLVLLNHVFCLLTVDYLLLHTITPFFSAKSLMKSFIKAKLYHLAYISGIGILSLFYKKYSWKGRELR